MNLTHYDLDSLVYLSTDIVIAELSPGATNNPGDLKATVLDALAGSLHTGQQINDLAPFLSFFRPMQPGMKVILFLDGRAHSYDFLHADAAKAPFAIPPSGVYLIDSFDHVHEYYQLDNPGPYVAEGYGFIPRETIPTEAQDHALPTLSSVRKEIADSLAYVETVRPLLEKVATPADVEPIFAFLEKKSDSGYICQERTGGQAMVERAERQIRSLHDPGLLLRLRTLSDASNGVSFVQREDGNRDPAFTASRVSYLLAVLGNNKQKPELRLAAAQILEEIARFHSGPQSGPSPPLPIDNEWLVSSASRIESTAKTVFLDKLADPQLRGVCLHFLPVESAAVASEIVKTYAHTRSPLLRFAIEEWTLKFSDSLYARLHAPGGPIASIVTAEPQRLCSKIAEGNVRLSGKYGELSNFRDLFGLSAVPKLVLTNEETGERLVPETLRSLGGWVSQFSGESWYELEHPETLPPGRYSARLVTSHQGNVISSGYAAHFVLNRTAKGRSVVIEAGD